MTSRKIDRVRQAYAAEEVTRRELAERFSVTRDTVAHYVAGIEGALRSNAYAYFLEADKDENRSARWWAKSLNITHRQIPRWRKGQFTPGEATSVLLLKMRDFKVAPLCERKRRLRNVYAGRWAGVTHHVVSGKDLYRPCIHGIGEPVGEGLYYPCPELAAEAYDRWQITRFGEGCCEFNRPDLPILECDYCGKRDKLVVEIEAVPIYGHEPKRLPWDRICDECRAKPPFARPGHTVQWKFNRQSYVTGRE